MYNVNIIELLVLYNTVQFDASDSPSPFHNPTFPKTDRRILRGSSLTKIHPPIQTIHRVVETVQHTRYPPALAMLHLDIEL